MRRKLIVFVFVIMIGIVMGYQNRKPVSVLETPKIKQVEIKGEVNHPGIYELAWDASVKDVLDAAGGVNANGDLANINQTRQAVHQEVIVIPPMKENGCISINGASKEELDTLPGIGETMAERIIVQRETSPFLQIEDLKRVKGIGEKTFEKLKDHICL